MLLSRRSILHIIHPRDVSTLKTKGMKVVEIEENFRLDSDLMAKSEKYDDFHDWVIEELKIFGAEEGATDAVQITYNAELKLRDPYHRFPKNCICLYLEAVEDISFEGLSSLQSELAGLKFERATNQIRISTEDGKQFWALVGKVNFD